MKLCVISFKECWRDASGAWMTDGGFPRQMAALASLVDEMVIVTPEVPRRAGGLPLPRAARLVPLPCPIGIDARRKLSILAGLRRYLRAIAAEVRAADAVHVPLPGDLPFIGMLVAQAYGKPLLARYGSSWRVNGETTMMNRVTKRWMRLIAGGRNVMVATGQADAPPAPRVHWLFSSAVSREELEGLDVDVDRGLSFPPRLVYAGRLSPEKNVAMLIRALAIVDAEAAAAHHLWARPLLTIAGDGPERAHLEAAARAWLPSGRVSFLGQLDREALSRCLRDADVCVHPSHTEGWCKAWLDAMAHGVPVIACDAGAARAVLGNRGERGIVVPPGDPAALAAAIVTLLDDTHDWAALRRRCHEYARSRTLEIWAARLGELCASQWGLSLVDGKLRPCH